MEVKNRLPFSLIYLKASDLYNKAATASSFEESIKYMDEFNKYIKLCGWTSEEFDSALLENVSKNWQNNNTN